MNIKPVIKPTVVDSLTSESYSSLPKSCCDALMRIQWLICEAKVGDDTSAGRSRF